MKYMEKSCRAEACLRRAPSMSERKEPSAQWTVLPGGSVLPPYTYNWLVVAIQRRILDRQKLSAAVIHDNHSFTNAAQGLVLGGRGLFQRP